MSLLNPSLSHFEDTEIPTYRRLLALIAYAPSLPPNCQALTRRSNIRAPDIIDRKLGIINGERPEEVDPSQVL